MITFTAYFFFKKKKKHYTLNKFRLTEKHKYKEFSKTYNRYIILPYFIYVPVNPPLILWTANIMLL